MSEQVMIYQLSDYQINAILSYASRFFAPKGHEITIENLAVTSEGDVILEFKKYGVLQTINIKRSPQ